MPRPLIIALTLSLVLHGGLLSTGSFRASPAPRAPVLQASLRLPPDVAELSPEAILPTETLLKNTIRSETPEEAVPASPPPAGVKRAAPISPPARERRMEALGERLSEYVFYPEQARRLSLEGTVTLFVELAGDGRVEDVRVTASSGHAILDNAAVKGFFAVGRLPGKSGYWDYTFRLE
jgi:protein TonB